MSDRLRDLDDKVFGRAVPDDRPMSRRLLRPRPAVWSGRGRFLFGLVLIGMFAVLRWNPDSLFGALAIVALFGAALLVSAADERKRARRFYDDSDE